MSLSSARVRILASYLILLLFSTIVGGIALRSVLLARAGERVDDALVQETREFRQLADKGRDPQTGDPFGDDIERIFDVFLGRNIPGEGEAFFTFVNGDLYRFNAPGRVRSLRIPEQEGLADTIRTRSGEFEIEDGRRIRYIAVPVLIDGQPRGDFVVAIDLTSELDEVNRRASGGRRRGPRGAGARIAAGVGGGRPGAGAAAPAARHRAVDHRDRPHAGGSRSRATTSSPISLAPSTRCSTGSRTPSPARSRSSATPGHELRTPITIVRGHLELLGDDDPEERDARRSSW